jgi:DNA processing protein
MASTDNPGPVKLEQRRRYFIALGLLPSATLGRVSRLSAVFDPETVLTSPKDIIEDSRIHPGDVSFVSRLATLDWARLLAEADKQVALSQKYQVRILTILDEDYPATLRESQSAPSILFVRGHLNQERDGKSVAVVGSREASDMGRKRAHQLARYLVTNNWVVVSGLARGIDAAAHEGALAMKGRTVAVVGCGLDRTYPPENADLAERIAATGAVISQFPFGEPPASHNFPQRNKTMALFSLATVVIEAGEKSGAKMQADFALSTQTPKRKVFFPKSLVDSQSETGWAHQYLRRGAEVIEQAEDVLKHLQRPLMMHQAMLL